MILIISKKSSEQSTEEVIDWIDYFGEKIIRINGDELFENGNLDISLINSELKIKYKNREILISEINFVWYRRWWDRDYSSIIDNSKIDYNVIDELITYQTSNVRFLRDILFLYLDKKKWLSYPSEISLNKIHVLLAASKLGLKIPATKICSTREELIKFFNSHKAIISKDLSDPIMLNDKAFSYCTMTNAISMSKILSLPNYFFPSIFQKLIIKKYEIRVFYLNQKCYSMAIFSQNDNQTKLDFRNYNYSRPNRTVPYNLPRNIERKIILLMQNLNLTTGSIDLIRDDRGDYIFLEINPIGQFGMVSMPCNYYLEKEIAEYLRSGNNVNNG